MYWVAKATHKWDDIEKILLVAKTKKEVEDEVEEFKSHCIDANEFYLWIYSEDNLTFQGIFCEHIAKLNDKVVKYVGEANAAIQANSDLKDEICKLIGR